MSIDDDGHSGEEPVPPESGEKVEEIVVEDEIEIADSDIVTDEQIEAMALTEGPFRRPSFWPSVAWTFALLGGQFVAVMFIVIIVAIAFVAMMAGGGPLDPRQLAANLEKSMEAWLLPVASFSTMLIAFSIVLLIYRNQTARCMGLRGMTVSQAVLILLLSLPMTVLTSEFTNWVAYLFPRMPMPEMFADFGKQSWWLVFPAACLFPGVGEELFFRGFLSRGLVSKHGVFWGAFFASFLFGAVHLHPVQASGAFLLGLVLQFVFLSTKSLWGAVLLHAANNALAFAAMKYGELMPIDGFTFVEEDAILHSPPLLVLAAFVAVGMLLFAVYRTRTDWQLPDGTIWSSGFVTAEGPLPSAQAQAVATPMGLGVSFGVLATYAAFLMTMSYFVRG